MRVFDEWLKTFRSSISDYKYYIDFQNVLSHTDEYKQELHLLGSLIGSKDIENEFKDILSKYPTTLKALPILIAKRELEIECMDECGSFIYQFDNMNYNVDQYVYFMKETGLFDLLQNHLISNLYDYVLGVNAALDSNGRKNRGGHLMEDLCESYIKKTGLPYGKEVYISEVEAKTGLNLSSISNNGEATKRFDFVIYGKRNTYGVECNFYAGGGSKLNETARSYKTIALEAKEIPGFKFVWLTDGQGWNSARKNLKETFDVLDTIFNINDLENGALNNLELLHTNIKYDCPQETLLKVAEEEEDMHI